MSGRIKLTCYTLHMVLNHIFVAEDKWVARSGNGKVQWMLAYLTGKESVSDDSLEVSNVAEEEFHIAVVRCTV